jgi:glycosyltransferase involved in cell wall biosynthesis
VGTAGISYEDEADLADKLQRVLRDGSLVQSYRHRAQDRVQRNYHWEGVVDCYEQLFSEIAGLPQPEHSRRREELQPEKSTTVAAK